MGTSTTAAQFAGKIERLGKELTDNRAALQATGMAGKRILEASAASSGALGKKPSDKRKPVSVGYDLVKDHPGGGAVMVFYRGAAHLINNPTKPHRIEPRRRRGVRTRRRGATALTINGDVRAFANHPGTRGKAFFQKAETIAKAKLPDVYARAGVTAPLRRVF